MKDILFYSNNSFHGNLCAHLFELKFKGTGKSHSKFHVPYRTLPLNFVENGDTVYIVGVFPDKKTIDTLLNINGVKVYLYTNNYRLVEDMEGVTHPNLFGSRTTRFSPIKAFNYELFGNTNELIRLIGAYHNWTFEDDKGNCESDAKSLIEGLLLTDGVWKDPTIWDRLLTDLPYLNTIIAKGMEVRKYLILNYRELCDDLMYPTSIDIGLEYPVKVLAINAMVNRDAFTFDRSYRHYDVYICYIRQGMEYRVTVYSDDPRIAANTIAMKFGGGGQKAVAGFRCFTLPFEQRPRQQSTGFTPIMGDPYIVSTKVLETKSFNNIVNHVRNSHSANMTVCGLDTQIVNSHILKDKILIEEMGADIDVLVSYVFTNSGKYRIVTRPLKPGVDLSYLEDKYDTTFFDGAYMHYSDMKPY